MEPTLQPFYKLIPIYVLALFWGTVQIVSRIIIKCYFLASLLEMIAVPAVQPFAWAFIKTSTLFGHLFNLVIIMKEEFIDLQRCSQSRRTAFSRQEPPPRDRSPIHGQWTFFPFLGNYATQKPRKSQPAAL